MDDAELEEQARHDARMADKESEKMCERERDRLWVALTSLVEAIDRETFAKVSGLVGPTEVARDALLACRTPRPVSG